MSTLIPYTETCYNWGNNVSRLSIAVGKLDVISDNTEYIDWIIMLFWISIEYFYYWGSVSALAKDSYNYKRCLC